MKTAATRRILTIACSALLFALSSSIALGARSSEGKKKLVMLIAENEYETAASLPVFAEKYLKKGFHVVTVSGPNLEFESGLEPIDEIKDADVLLVSTRRRTPPATHLEVIRQFVASGRPVVGIRTASHALSRSKGKELPAGRAEWPEFDAEVFGGNYSGHHGRGTVLSTLTNVTAPNPQHPLLRGVSVPFSATSSLYKTGPLRPGTDIILMGKWMEHPPEPVAWTFKRADGGRSFYCSLGNVVDFKSPSFNALLRNGIYWAAGMPVPAK